MGRVLSPDTCGFPLPLEIAPAQSNKVLRPLSEPQHLQRVFSYWAALSPGRKVLPPPSNS